MEDNGFVWSFLFQREREDGERDREWKESKKMEKMRRKKKKNKREE